MRINFLLIDFENVQPKNIGRFNGRSFKVRVFLGTHQTKVPLEMARALQALGPDAEYVQVEGSGKNALDFHIAYYIGRLATQHPDAFFHIVSRDTGFDPLVKHLKGQQILCQRSASIDRVPLVGVVDSKSMPERVDTVVDNLTRREGRPKTVKALRGTLKTLFQGQVSDDDLTEMLEELSRRRCIDVTEGKVIYHLPSRAA